MGSIQTETESVGSPQSIESVCEKQCSGEERG